MFSAGLNDKAYRYLNEYSRKRLLGEHVPYPIEAWPEGDQRHLSAEGGLYARVIIEGMLGITPTGFRSFKLSPSVPARLGRISLSKIKAFGSCFDIEVERSVRKYDVRITNADGTEQLYSIPLDGSVEVNI